MPALPWHLARHCTHGRASTPRGLHFPDLDHQAYADSSPTPSRSESKPTRLGWTRTRTKRVFCRSDGESSIRRTGVLVPETPGPTGATVGRAHRIASDEVLAKDRCRSCARVGGWSSACWRGIRGRPSFSAPSITCARRCPRESAAETGIERPGCITRDHTPWREQPMTTIDRGPRRGVVPNGDVCLATVRRFTRSAEPQTRLFWD
jgi:hypothetical protein